METSALTQLMYCFCVLSALLLIGAFLRAKISIFRKLFLPASVIGGFIGLMLSPIIWGKYAPVPFPQEWITTWSSLPGILIVPVVACVPLGMKLKSKNEKKQGHTSSNVIKMFGIIAGMTALQGAAGLFVQFLLNTFGGMDLYRAFGYELPSGFSGGHGTAGIIGGHYQELGLPFWKIAQGVTTTTATFGLIGGMLIGIIAINIAARKGKTAVLSKPEDIPEEIAKGFQLDKEKQAPLGRETTMNSSIESLTFHLSIVLLGCGIAYGLVYLFNKNNVPGLGSIPVWAYAIIIMFAVNFIIQKLNMGTLVDSKTKSRIAGTCSDYAITAAIVSLPVEAIMDYIVPILIVVAVGFIVTYFTVTFLCNRFFDDYKFERSMACMGTCTGVFLTGMMLLKLCDPDYKTPVLNDYSIGFSLTSVTSFILMTVFINLILRYDSWINALIQFGVCLLFIGIAFLAHKASKKDEKNFIKERQYE